MVYNVKVTGIKTAAVSLRSPHQSYHRVLIWPERKKNNDWSNRQQKIEENTEGCSPFI
jgi:hypothetical protein